MLYPSDWRSPPPVLSTYQPDAQTVDVYLESTRHAIVDGTRYSLSPGWLGCVPYQEGMTFQELEDALPQHFPVSLSANNYFVIFKLKVITVARL